MAAVYPRELTTIKHTGLSKTLKEKAAKRQKKNEHESPATVAWVLKVSRRRHGTGNRRATPHTNPFLPQFNRGFSAESRSAARSQGTLVNP